MLKKIQEFIREKQMLEQGDRVIAAVSGGADSVCLLYILHAFFGIQIRAIHVHHGLRGEEADRDEAFVRMLCKSYQIPLTVVHRRAAQYAKEHGVSTEEAGRILRYQAFEAEADRWMREEPGAPVKIAVAHHQDDSAETILYHLLRGSGLKGLSGIRPVQGNRIRPLLCVSHSEILNFLQEQGIEWCEDSTNQKDDYTRNRIRNQILPMMREQVNCRAGENILRAGEIFAQADAYLEEQARKIWDDKGIGEDAAAEIPLSVFLSQPPIIRTYLIRHMLDLAAFGWKDLTAKHFAQLNRLAEGGVGGRADLPGGLRGVRTYETLRIERESEVKKRQISLENLTFSELLGKNQQEIPENQYTKWFDYDKIKDTLSVRYRQTGDYLMLPDGKKKTVARYMIDEKIPRDQRDQIPVLADGSHILWVIGYRISEYYKITDTTKRILQVKVNGGEEHGR